MEEVLFFGQAEGSRSKRSVARGRRRKKDLSSSKGTVKISLRASDTAGRRRILYLQRARSDIDLSYLVTGEDGDLFGLRQRDGGIWGLFYLREAPPNAEHRVAIRQRRASGGRSMAAEEEIARIEIKVTS